MTDDDELLARFRASDPAGSLPPVAPHEVARLLEDVMATELTTETRETGTHGRGPLTWLVAAAAVLVIAGVGFLGINALTGDDTTPLVSEPVPQTMTSLEVPDAGAAKCAMPSAEILANADLAIDGTVTEIYGDEVVLTPTRWYAGEPTDVVRLTAPGKELRQMLSGVEFQQGDRYLVSASGGQVSLCGFSAPYSDELAAIYAEAFPT